MHVELQAVPELFGHLAELSLAMGSQYDTRTVGGLTKALCLPEEEGEPWPENTAVFITFGSYITSKDRC